MKQAKKVSFDELKERSREVLMIADDELRLKFAQIAKISATQAEAQGNELALEHFGPKVAKTLATANRNLGRLFKQYPEKFDELVARRMQ